MNSLNNRVKAFLFVLAVILSSNTYPQSTSGSAFLQPTQAFRPSVAFDGKTVSVDWRIADGYFLYRHGFKLELDRKGSKTRVSYNIAKGKKKFDEFLEKNVETYRGAVRMTAELSPPLEPDTQILLTSQGCADEGFCFPPTTQALVFGADNVLALKSTDANGISVSSGRDDVIDSALSSTELWITLFGAALGGLILNLMPCVFPVLSLKALTLASGHESKKSLRQHGWAYTAGVVLSFVIAASVILLARATGQSLGWGFQLQHPVFVAFMAYLFLVMGLHLSGAFEFGGGLMGVGQRLTTGHSMKSSFFTGVLAALVASPCTAPFMATALGVALTQPTHISYLIFISLGFGMALPFLALSFVPAISKWMPRPGQWMVTFKQFLSFPMYLTAIWLLWVLSHQVSGEAVILTLIGMLFIVFSLWLGGLTVTTVRTRVLRNMAALLLAAPALYIASNHASTQSPVEFQSSHYERYSQDKLKDYQSRGVPVFVDLTADWCITCKMNEQVALTESVKRRFNEDNIVFLVGDWTNRNQEVSELLKKYGRSGVPLYLMYPKGGGSPEVLPQILTQDIMQQSMTRALQM